MEYFNITIDGPTSAGKGAIAKLTAEKLGFVHVDTEAMYRSVTLYFIRQGISPEDEETIARAYSRVEVTIRYADGAQQIILGGEDVSGLIHSEEVERMASTTSVYGPVRQKLIQLRKQLAKEADVVMDGRDIGACMLPDVPTKTYLTASVETRVRHRFRELEEKEMVCDIREIEKDVEERDYRDMYRENSPLRQAENAMLLDSSHMIAGQVVDSIIHIARERGYEG